MNTAKKTSADRKAEAVQVLHEKANALGTTTPHEDLGLDMLYALTHTMARVAIERRKQREMAEHVGLGRDQWRLDRFYGAREGIAARLVDAASEVLGVQPHVKGSGEMEDDAFTSASTQMIQCMEQVMGNTRYDLLVQYAADVDRLRAEKEGQNYPALKDDHERLVRLAQDVVNRPSSKKAREALAAALEA